MRQLLIIITILFACLKSQAQINLVYNPSFEEHWRCPQYHDLVKYANYWSSINDTLVSDTDTLGFPPYFYGCLPEYCNTCSFYNLASIPASYWYYHYPRTGNGMMNVRMYYNEIDTESVLKRDYLQGRLKNTLVLGDQYCVTFYVTLTGGSAYAINRIGAYFDDATIDTSTNCGLVQSMYTPQICETVIISDTLNWTKVQGIFTASGNENFLTIGNFFDASHTDSLRMHFSLALAISNSIASWYLVDDVSVIKVGTTAYAGNDTMINIGDTVWVGNHDGYLPVKWYSNGALIDSNHAGFAVHPDSTTNYVMELDVCGSITYDTMTVTVKPVGIKSVSLSYVKVYPNPVKDEVMVTGFGANVSFRLLNTLGVCIKQGELNKATIGVNDLPPGMYVLELSNSSDRRSFKIMKQ